MCHGGLLNTQTCGYDGGDCCRENYVVCESYDCVDQCRCNEDGEVHCNGKLICFVPDKLQFVK